MTAKSPERVDFAHVKRVVPLIAILSRYGLDGEFRRVGASLRGACPIHKGSNKRQFVIDPNASTWRCFGDCNRGGASLEFVAEIERVGIREAAVLIAQWFAIAMPRRLEQPQPRRKTVSGGKPSHKAYVVEDREGDEDDKGFWTRIGSAWPHKDGKGLNVVLAALPANGRLVLREYTDEDAAEDEKKAASNKTKRR
jgi:hypothetical protein